jgi:hypothetical protein
MNEAHQPSRGCEYEDRVLATFLDGDPTEDVNETAAHLERCEHCAEALRQARSLDALLAAHTHTDIDDAHADRLLAAVDAGESKARTAPVLEWRRWIPAVAAAVLIATFAAWWALRSDSRPDRTSIEGEGRPPVAEPGPAPAPLAPEPVDRVAHHATGLPLPDGSGRVALRRERAALSDVDLLALLGEARVPGLASRRVRDGVERVLAEAARPAADGAPPDRELVVAAARWQLEEVRRGFAPTSRMLRTGRLLLDSRGVLRRELVALHREHEGLVRRLVRSRLARSPRDPAVLELVGALGLEGFEAQLRDLDEDRLQACVVQARRTADNRCLDWLVGRYLETAERVPDRLEECTGWFVGLGQDAGEALIAVLQHRVERSRNHAVRMTCSDLALRIGLSESLFDLFARAGPARRASPWRPFRPG